MEGSTDTNGISIEGVRNWGDSTSRFPGSSTAKWNLGRRKLIGALTEMKTRSIREIHQRRRIYTQRISNNVYPPSSARPTPSTLSTCSLLTIARRSTNLSPALSSPPTTGNASSTVSPNPSCLPIVLFMSVACRFYWLERALL